MRSVIPRPTSEYDLKLLRIFCAVVEHGGFSAAENALGITRSTISVHMSNLESRMNLILCLRGRSGFSLTEDGMAVYNAAISLFESLNDFSILVHALGKELHGEVVILCADQLDSNKQQKLAEVIRHLHQQAPNIHITFENDTIANIQKQLLDDKAHVGILPTFYDIDGLVYRTLFDEPVYLCCAHNHPLFNLSDEAITQQMLANALTVHPGLDLDNTGRAQLQKLNLSAKSYQFDTRKTLILSGQYLGFMPEHYVKQELNAGTLRFIQPDCLSYPFRLSLVSKKFPKETKKTSLVVDAFNRVFQFDQHN